MNEFTDKNEQAFLDACGAIGVEPNGMVNTQKARYLRWLAIPVSLRFEVVENANRPTVDCS